MPDKEKIIDDLSVTSNQISSQVRTLAISLMALAGGALIGEPASLNKVIGNHVCALLAMGVFAFASLVVDWFQYVAGYICSRSTLRKVEEAGDKDGKFSYGGAWYKVRTWFFWIKQALIVIAVSLFGYILICSVLPCSSSKKGDTPASCPAHVTTDKVGPSGSQR